VVLQYIAAIVLIAHGLGHSIYIMASWAGISVGFRDRTWILPGGHSVESTVGMAWGMFWAVALALFVAAGTGVIMERELWRTYALIGSLVSIVAVLPWARTVVVGALAGVLLDIAVILVLLLPWGDKVTEFFGVP
jgi:hypothetical protein